MKYKDRTNNFQLAHFALKYESAKSFIDLCESGMNIRINIQGDGRTLNLADCLYHFDFLTSPDRDLKEGFLNKKGIASKYSLEYISK
jgi:hypothetical protein